MIEIKEERKYIRMPHAINNHSERTYEVNRPRYVLDRTTDAIPRFFTLYAISYPTPNTITFPNIIKINNLKYWGDGISWKQAEQIIEPILANISDDI